jgi:hypothetical protein
MIEYPLPPCFEGPFRISRNGVAIDPDPAVEEAITRAFDHSQGAVFTGVLEQGLLDILLRLSRAANFNAVATEDFADRGIDGRDSTAVPMCVALARPNLLSWLEQVTGCEPITTVEGVLARMGPGDFVEWHRDAFHGVRRLAVVINLSEQPFEGGRFEMRRRDTQEPLFAYSHESPGSMMVLRLGPELQHRVTPVTGGGPRVTFAGWFRAPIQSTEARRLPCASIVPSGFLPSGA